MLGWRGHIVASDVGVPHAGCALCSSRWYLRSASFQARACCCSAMPWQQCGALLISNQRLGHNGVVQALPLCPWPGAMGPSEGLYGCVFELKSRLHVWVGSTRQACTREVYMCLQCVCVRGCCRALASSTTLSRHHNTMLHSSQGAWHGGSMHHVCLCQVQPLIIS